MVILAAVWTCCCIYLGFDFYWARILNCVVLCDGKLDFPFALPNSVLPQTFLYVARINKGEEMLGSEALKQWCGDTLVKGHTSFIVFNQYEIPSYPDSLSKMSSLSTGRRWPWPYNTGLWDWRSQGSCTYQEGTSNITALLPFLSQCKNFVGSSLVQKQWFSNEGEWDDVLLKIQMAVKMPIRASPDFC